MDITRIAPPQPYKALIFDCDGTLADTMPNHFKAWAASLQSFGADLTEENFYRMGGWPNQAIIEDLNREFGYGLDIEKDAGRQRAALSGDCCTPSRRSRRSPTSRGRTTARCRWRSPPAGSGGWFGRR